MLGKYMCKFGVGSAKIDLVAALIMMKLLYRQISWKKGDLASCSGHPFKCLLFLKKVMLDFLSYIQQM